MRSASMRVSSERNDDSVRLEEADDSKRSAVEAFHSRRRLDFWQSQTTSSSTTSTATADAWLVQCSVEHVITHPRAGRGGKRRLGIRL